MSRENVKYCFDPLMWVTNVHIYVPYDLWKSKVMLEGLIKAAQFELQKLEDNLKAEE